MAPEVPVAVVVMREIQVIQEPQGEVGLLAVVALVVRLR